MPFFKYGKKLNLSILSIWTLGEQLGSEGKDGFIRSVTNNNVEGAMKIFKDKKSIKKIINEINYQKIAASNNIAPPILSNWEITVDTKCFVMKKMNRTLLKIIKDQNETLFPSQVNRLIHLYTTLSNLKILHNDTNVLRNIIEDDDGVLYLIDFGLAKKFTSKTIKEKGPNPNLSLLAEIDHALKSNYFTQLISNYEKKHNVVIDYKRKIIKDREEKIKKVLEMVFKK